jgi:outer membrane protein assembly factor BamB
VGDAGQYSLDTQDQIVLSSGSTRRSEGAQVHRAELELVAEQEHMKTCDRVLTKYSPNLLFHRLNHSWGWLVVYGAAASLACGADWPQFMGANGDGTSAETGLARSWPVDGPKVLWTVPVGPGYGGAAIRDGKVYLVDRINRQKDVLRVLELATGKEDWTFEYEAPGEIDHDGSRSTPAVTAKHVFTVGPFGDFYCLELATHQVVWKKNVVSDYGTKPPRWAVTQSPILYKDLVLVAPQAEQAGIAAFEQGTGKERWRSASIGPMAYGSPMLIRLEGIEQSVIVNPLGVTSVSAEDGKVLWKYAHPCKIPIPNVTVLGGGKLFVTGAYMAGSAVIQVSRQGENWAIKELGRNEHIGGHCHPALAFQDHAYVLCNVNERSDGMVCFDSQCQVVWQTKNSPNLDKGGSILTADGLIYVMDGRTGELHIVEPSPNGFKSLAKTKLLEGQQIWGPIALADGKLVMRDQKQMRCVDISNAPGARAAAL